MPLSGYGKPYTFKAPPVDPNPGFSMTAAPRAASGIGAGRAIWRTTPGHDPDSLDQIAVLSVSVRLIHSVRPFAKCSKLASSGGEANSV
jgi:hypothetical protein